MVGGRSGQSRPVKGGSWRSAAAIAGAALAILTVVSAAQLYAFRRAAGEPVTLFQSLASGAANWVVWALALPGILVLGRRFDFSPGRRIVSGVVHLLALVAVHVPATAATIAAGMALFAPGETFPMSEAVRQLFAGSRFQLAVLVYGSVLGLGRAVQVWRALGERETQAARLEAQATRARLEALASRLEPHFLFNALHTVGALIDEDPRRARATVVALGDLLRRILAEPQATDVTLGEELDLVDEYLAIERIRFADRLRVEVDVPEALRDVRVPRLLLQPLVENALRHGIAPRAAGGRIRLTAERSAGAVTLRVFNDGARLAGLPPDGTGLATTRQRLATRFDGRASLSVGPVSEGVEAVIRIEDER